MRRYVVGLGDKFNNIYVVYNEQDLVRCAMMLGKRYNKIKIVGTLEEARRIER